MAIPLWYKIFEYDEDDTWYLATNIDVKYAVREYKKDSL